MSHPMYYLTRAYSLRPIDLGNPDAEAQRDDLLSRFES